MNKFLLLSLSVGILSCHPVKSNDKPVAPKVINNIPAVPSPQKEVVTDTRCPANTVYVEGDWCADLSEPCLAWGDTKEVNEWNDSHPDATKRREYNICLEFKYPTVCHSTKLKHVQFCMDKYEYPNVEGAMPDVMMSYLDMERLCAARGERVCKDYEFNKACEGPDNKPYPYGYKRDVTACNINRPYIDWDMQKVTDHDWDEVNRLSQRVPSGQFNKCVSDYGVHDIVGNVDEFYTNSYGVPSKVAMMGGHWIHGARNRCRAATLDHNEWFYIYEAGGRCCKDSE